MPWSSWSCGYSCGGSSRLPWNKSLLFRRNIGSHVHRTTPLFWRVLSIFIHLIASLSCLFYEELVSLVLPSPRASLVHSSLGVMSIFSPMYWELQRNIQPGLCPLEVDSRHGLPSIGPGSSLSLHLHLCHSLIYKPQMAPCFSVGNAKLVGMDTGPSMAPFCLPTSLSSCLSGPPVHTTARNLYHFQAVSLFMLFSHFGSNALPHWLPLFISYSSSQAQLKRPLFFLPFPDLLLHFGLDLVAASQRPSCPTHTHSAFTMFGEASLTTHCQLPLLFFCSLSLPALPMSRAGQKCWEFCPQSSLD